MKRSSELFRLSDAMDLEDLGGGVSRKIMGWDNQIMMVEVNFEEGAVGSPHQHFQTQTSYCTKGKFEFTIGAEKQTIKEGDGVYVPPNVIHGAICLEAGVLIDVFNPVREDFLDGSTVSYFDKK